MIEQRESLPTCEYGVPVANENQVESCQQPAVARWSWDHGRTWLYVCEEHDAVVEAGEEAMEETDKDANDG